MYLDLKKEFYIDSKNAERLYQTRYNDPSATHIDLRDDAPFFYWMASDVYSKMLAIERLDRKVEYLVSSIPETAIEHYISECMIDEIILTNDIEGVISTRKEIEAAMEALSKKDKRMRFKGIVNKYNSLVLAESIPMNTCEDIRDLYDDLVFEEVAKADPDKIPDGELFRKDAVRVVDAANRVIHENAFSEERIKRELLNALRHFNDADIEPLVRAAVFHFSFAFIHPFYDGNGRMNRFMSSYLISQETSRFAGIRLSYSVKENIEKYYQAFTLAEHPLSKGDLTPFILTFFDIVIDALQKTYEALTVKSVSLQEHQTKLTERFRDDPKVDVEKVGSALLQGALFTSSGLSVDKISHDTCLSVPTIHKRLKQFKEAGLLVRNRPSRYAYYSIDVKKL